MTGVLRLFDHLARPISRLGIDYDQFRTMLGVKLTLDGRRRHGWVQGVGKIPPLLWSLGVHGLMGLGVAALPLAISSPFAAMTVSHSVIMLVLAFDLVADYSAVLLDSADGSVCDPLPVAARTALAARVVHVALYLCMYVGALAAGTGLVGTVTYGPIFLPVYLLTLLSMVVLVLAGVTFVYLVVMRVVSRERVRDLVMVAQIGMTVVTVAGYFAMSSVTSLRTFSLDGYAWLYAYPPAWMAGMLALAVGEPGAGRGALVVLGLLVPGLLAGAALHLAPAFRVDHAAPARSSRAARHPTARWLARLVTRGPQERGAFEFLWTIAARDRQFKTRTYPALVAVVLFVTAFAVAAQRGAWADRIPDLAATDLHLFLLYYTLAVIPTPLLMLPYTDQPEAAWIHRALPLARPGPVLVAGLKVLVLRLVVPAFVVTGGVILTIWGGRVIPDLVLALATTMLAAAGIALVIGRRLPFSEPPPGGAGGTTMATMISYMLLVAIAGAAHWTLGRLGGPPQPWPVILAVPVVSATAWALARIYAATPWHHLPPPP